MFPPTGGAGIQRNVKFIKYLSRMGWQITILTPKNPSVPTKDASFTTDIPSNVNVEYTCMLEPSYSIKKRVRSTLQEKQENKLKKIFRGGFRAAKMMAQSVLLPDIQILWALSSFPAALSLIKRKKFNVIFVSGPPFSSLVFASWLSRITGVPYVADFRDEWVDFIDIYYDSHKKIFGKGVVRRMEYSVVKHASSITMATPSYVKNLRNKYPIASGKTFEITNGFDIEDYPPHFFEDVTPTQDRLRITYFGSVINVNTARYFLEACRRLLLEKPKYKEQIEIHFVGRIDDDEDGYINKYIVEVPIVRHGYVEHRKMIEMMKLSDVLLALVDDIPGAERMISGKIFEYLYSRKPVLAVVPQGGEVDHIVRTSGCGISCAPRDFVKIATAVESMILKWEQGILHKEIKSNENFIQSFSREILASKLSKILLEAYKNTS